MILEPSFIVLYVDDLVISNQFYQDLLGINPINASTTFSIFTLSNGMNLALKAKHSVIPPTKANASNGELAFTLDNNKKMDELFTKWQTRGITVIFPPSQEPFGYTFVAVDPDGNRLRAVSALE
ncbi:MAG: VOC family protein [Legionellaceae bacterium]|nr:VOC family protein [Legionellaceae bacterium]